jgi:hypothetical protein
MPTFEPGKALEAFRAFLAGRALNEASLSVRDGFDAMLDFYVEERASGCRFDEDGDMLLFQWGTYLTLRPDGSMDEASNLNLTRQLILEGGEDDDIWQLALNFEFNPTEFRDLKSGNKWCRSLEELPQFREYVLASVPFTGVQPAPRPAHDAGLRMRRLTCFPGGLPS